MSTLEEILSAAQSLPPGERSDLILALWDTLVPEEWPRPSDEWIVECELRSIEVDAGRMSVSPWEEARERIRRKAGLDE